MSMSTGDLSSWHIVLCVLRLKVVVYGPCAWCSNATQVDTKIEFKPWEEHKLTTMATTAPDELGRVRARLDLS